MSWFTGPQPVGYAAVLAIVFALAAVVTYYMEGRDE